MNWVKIFSKKVKNENKCGLDIEQRNKVIKKAFSNNEINGTTMIQYAKKQKCEKKIRAIMEVMNMVVIDLN